MSVISPEVLPAGHLHIGGRQIAESSLGRHAHVNPASGEIQAELTLAGPVEIDMAVRAAREAFPAWRDTPATERRDLLRKLADLLLADGERMEKICVLDNGTPIAFSRFAASISPADWFNYYAGWADKIDGQTISVPGSALDYTLLEPYGVVGLLIAFNGPAAFIGFKAAPALAAGNTVVLKPSEMAPWTSLRFAELAAEAGFPPGVINVVPGDGRAGAALAGHPDVDKLSFTGGGAAAKQVLIAAAENFTPATLELGGKSAAIIFDDADLAVAISTIVQTSIALLSGQVCLAGTRVLVQRSIYDQVVEAVRIGAESLVLGDPSDPGTHMGPVISSKSCERIQAFVKDAESRGDGRIVAGGAAAPDVAGGGSYVQPTVFADVDPESPLAQEEIFGPVLAIIPFDDDSDAIRIANGTPYGLAGYIFTTDLRRAHLTAKALDAGYIAVNTFALCPPGTPFGGVKGSGYGREGGWDGIQEMLRTKNIQVSLV